MSRKTEEELRAMNAHDVRRYARENGYNISGISERKKEDLIRIIVDMDRKGLHYEPKPY